MLGGRRPFASAVGRDAQTGSRSPRPTSSRQGLVNDLATRCGQLCQQRRVAPADGSACLDSVSDRTRGASSACPAADYGIRRSK